MKVTLDMAWNFARLIAAFIAILSLSGCQSTSNKGSSSSSKSLNEVKSMVRNSDGTFTVVCSDGKTSIATQGQIRNDDVCNGGNCIVEPYYHTTTCGAGECVLDDYNLRVKCADQKGGRCMLEPYNHTITCGAGQCVLDEYNHRVQCADQLGGSCMIEPYNHTITCGAGQCVLDEYNHRVKCAN